MLKQSDMHTQSTFFKYDDGNWYDGNFEYQLTFSGSKGGMCMLNAYDETDGSCEEIKRIKDISHLKHMYEILTNYIFV